MRSVELLCIVMFFSCGIAQATDWSREGEFLIDTNVVFIPDTNSQHNPAIAFDETNYLVVWEDDRNGDWDIYGARVDQAGNVIDPVVIPISTELNDQRNPAICFCGADYLVVWDDTRNDSLGDIYGTRVNQAGIILDSAGIMISNAPYRQRHPAIAFDGVDYLVVWEDARNDTLYYWRTDIFGARVNQNGIVLDPDGVAIKVDPVDPYWTTYDLNPSLVFDGLRYFVVWMLVPGPMPDHSVIYGIRIDPTGVALDTVDITGPSNAASPDIAFDGTNYFVARFDDPDAASPGVYGARIDQSGVILDTTMFISYTPAGLARPSIVYDGTYYVTAWNYWLQGSPGDIYGAKLNTSGLVIDSFAVSLQQGDQGPPAVASGVDGQVLITYSGWTDSVSGNSVNRMRIWGRFYPFVGVEEDETSVVRQYNLTATILRGPLRLPDGENCRVFDITGRVVEPDRIQPGIYFIEVDGVVTQKVVKVR